MLSERGIKIDISLKPKILSVKLQLLFFYTTGKKKSCQWNYDMLFRDVQMWGEKRLAVEQSLGLVLESMKYGRLLDSVIVDLTGHAVITQDVLMMVAVFLQRRKQAQSLKRLMAWCKQKQSRRYSLQILQISVCQLSGQARPLVTYNSMLRQAVSVYAFRHDATQWSSAFSNPLGNTGLRVRAWPLILCAPKLSSTHSQPLERHFVTINGQVQTRMPGCYQIKGRWKLLGEPGLWRLW